MLLVTLVNCMTKSRAERVLHFVIRSLRNENLVILRIETLELGKQQDDW